MDVVEGKNVLPKTPMTNREWNLYRLNEANRYYTLEQIFDPVLEKVRRFTFPSNGNHDGNHDGNHERKRTYYEAFLFVVKRRTSQKVIAENFTVLCAGKSREFIQSWISNERESQTHPIFSSKPPPKPMVPRSRNQIDLFSGNFPLQNRENIQVFNVFSRYLFLRPLTSKLPVDVAKEVNKICIYFHFSIFSFCL